MDPEFQRALGSVLLIGTIIGAIATTTLIVIFRQFGGRKAGTSQHIALIFGLIAFLVLCCILLLVLSYRA
ncbi:MAG: hypothetical protein M3Q69_12725 [Acidobacteriota bacterium]|nr:hypothetical protein [Acidobacteriota bacterium]